MNVGRICIGGTQGKCGIYQPSEELKECFNEYARWMYSYQFAAVPFFSPPLKYIFDGVHEGSLQIADAVNVVARPIYNSLSIEEWVYAHQIVMKVYEL